MKTKTRIGTFSCIGAALLMLSGCGGGGSSTVTPPTPPTPPAVHNQWTWQGGSQSINPAGNYGTLGVAAATNVPGPRYSGMTWTDAAGNFWLFGGIDLRESGGTENLLNDLWKYSGGQWTWMGGSNGYNQLGVYGTKGSPAPGNIPGARRGAATWIDASGNLWLFGGSVAVTVNSTPTSGLLNDLWKYSNGQWTWISGSDDTDLSTSASAIYGTLGVASPDNVPGGRNSSVSWTDSSGNLWLLGGGGYEIGLHFGYLNDIWKYSNGLWTWMGGGQYVDDPGFVGAPDDPTNRPSARTGSSGAVDAQGNLWLMGGEPALSGESGFTNDLWKYSNGQWTFLSGFTGTNEPGTYGSKGTPGVNNVPGARALHLTWTDSSGDLWLLGGIGTDSTGTAGSLNDLWKYSGGQWTWVSGSNLGNQSGVYGNQGATVAGNIMGGRAGTMMWKDSKGNPWFFGGYGYDASGNIGLLNDLWEYQP